jgi:hypothetical protein
MFFDQQHSIMARWRLQSRATKPCFFLPPTPCERGRERFDHLRGRPDPQWPDIPALERAGPLAERVGFSQQQTVALQQILACTGAVVIGTFALPRLTERQYRLEVRIVLSC